MPSSGFQCSSIFAIVLFGQVHLFLYAEALIHMAKQIFQFESIETILMINITL